MPTLSGWLAYCCDCCVRTMPGPRPCISAGKAGQAHRMVDDETTTPTAMTTRTAADATPCIASLSNQLSLTKTSSCSLPSTCSTRCVMRRALVVHEDGALAHATHIGSQGALGKHESIVHRTHA